MSARFPAKAVSRRFLAGVLPAMLLLVSGGCASVVPQFDIPLDPYSGNPTIRSIVDRFSCELANLVAPGAPNRGELLTGQYEVAAQLDLTVNDTGGLAPSMTYIDGLFSFDAAAKLQQSREQYFSVKLFYSMLDLADEVDRSEREYMAGTRKRRKTDCTWRIDTNLAGELGIAQTVDLALNVTNLDVTAKASSQGAFGGSVNFTVTKNLSGVGPTFVLTRLRGPGGLASVSEVNTDKLTFAFAVSETPLTAGQLARRGFGVQRQTSVTALRIAGTSKADQFLQQLQVNQIANQLSTIRALR